MKVRISCERFGDINLKIGDDYVHTFKYGTNMWGFNYMQTIGRNLVLGFELLNLVKK